MDSLVRATGAREDGEGEKQIQHREGFLTEAPFGSAITWAETVLGSPIRACEPLLGGLTSTMLAITDETGAESVLRLMTNHPWRAHGPALTRREQAALQELEPTPVPAPVSLGLDAEGTSTGTPAHLMTRLPGIPTETCGAGTLGMMAETLATIHRVQPAEPFRTFQSWAPRAKWHVPEWSRHPHVWQRAFDMLEEEPPRFQPTFLHRDFSHRNLLWHNGEISGVVDWVETSNGPAWLDAGHAATNLAIAFGADQATGFLDAYSAITGAQPETHWLIMDAVGFLPPPGKEPLFASQQELSGLDSWLDSLVSGPLRR